MSEPKSTATRDPNKGILTLAFSVMVPVGDRYKALVTALNQFVENAKDAIDVDCPDPEEVAMCNTAEELLDILNAREAALADK